MGDGMDQILRARHAVDQDAAADQEHRRGAGHRQRFHQNRRGAQNAAPETAPSARREATRAAPAPSRSRSAAAVGPALQAVGIGWGYHLFNIVPYVLTLLILVLSCRPGQLAAGSPGELSSR